MLFEAAAETPTMSFANGRKPVTMSPWAAMPAR